MTDILQTRPLPSLHETVSNYLDNVKPLVAEAEFEHTSTLCEQFLSGAGPGLHEKLQAIYAHAGQPNWNAGFWDSMYLQFRDPLPIHSSPFFAVCDQPVLEGLSLADSASRLVYATNAVILSIRDGSFSPEFSKGIAQDMVQYEHFFGYARNPQVFRDEKRFDSSSSSICVLHRNHVFLLSVLNKDGSSVSMGALRKDIDNIVQRAGKKEENNQFIGYFSTQERDYWAKKKGEIASLSAENREALRKIDSALYVLCLDEEPVADLNDRATRLLHNEGRNRFFDKYQIVTAKGGKIGSIFEHAPVDALSVGRIWNETIKHLLDPQPCNHPSGHEQHASDRASELTLALSSSLREDVEHSRQKFQRLVRHTQQDVLLFREFGTSQVKKLGMSPDACIQLLFQLSYFNAFGVNENVYESVSTRQFFEGRTDVLRPITQQSLEFVRCAGALSKDDALEQLQQAVQSIVERRKISACGRAPDHHLSALNQLAQQEQNNSFNYEVPALFRGSTYQAYTRTVVSTSNISDPLCLMFGFGPVTPGGVGIAYGTFPEHFIFHLSFFDDTRCRIDRFRQELERSLRYLKELM